jgi:hypothetical protein
MSAFQIKDKTSQPASTMPRAELTRSGPVSPRGRTRGLAALRRVLRFVLHVVEMCAAMCVGAIGLSVLFFGGAAMVGYTNLPERAPVLTVVVVAINLSLPMAAWMRFRGMAWRLNLCSPLVAGAPHHQHLACSIVGMSPVDTGKSDPARTSRVIPAAFSPLRPARTGSIGGKSGPRHERNAYPTALPTRRQITPG